MVKVVIYSTQFCPYCVRAKMLLKNKNVEFTDIRIDVETNRRSEMEKRSGRNTVPQIFIRTNNQGRGMVIMKRTQAD